MTITPFLLLILFTVSTAKFHCRDNKSPCSCTPSSIVPGENQIFCPTDRRRKSGFNVSFEPKKYFKVECRNSPDWSDFSMKSKLDLWHVDRLVFLGCELPNARIIGEVYGIDWVKLLKIEQLKGNVYKQHFDAYAGLKTLVLSNNHLGKVDADLLYGLKNLTKLDLHSTKIQIPAEFFTKSNSLTHLDLSSNEISHLEPGTFDGLSNLKILNLSHNDFDFMKPKFFRGLSSLKFLDISACHLFALANNIFHDTPSLISVNLSANKFISLPANLFSHCQGLKFVQISHNVLNLTKLPSKLFTDLDNLRVVSLESVGLHHLPEDLFWGSNNLNVLNLNGNELVSLPVDLLEDAYELRKFSASSNKLQALPESFFANANKLMKLDLSKNRITTLDANFFDGLYSLLEINLEYNKLGFIHSNAFVSLRHLRLANLAHNRLNFEKTSSPFGHCSRLEELNLAHNEVAKISSDWNSHARLRKIDLSYNNFNYVETKDLQFVSNRLFVDLSYNNISIVNISSAKQQHHQSIHRNNVTINLNDNPIECYCEVYSLQRYAIEKTLFFQDAELQIDDITCSAPKNLQGLRLSELVDTRLECSSANKRGESCVSNGVCDCWIVPTNRTLNFDCARRNLTESPVWIKSWGSDLYVSMNLSRNVLTKVPKMTKNGYENVQSLDLSGNRIDFIDENLVSPMLRSLHLEHNNLTSIDADLIKKLTKTVDSLHLHGNPWLCDDTTLAFRRYVQEYKFFVISNYREVLCNDTQEPVWYKPMTLVDFFELLLCGFGALLISLTFLGAFLAMLIYILMKFLHHAASSNDVKR